MRGANPHDPVQALNLPGRPVGVIRCPHMMDPVPGLFPGNPRRLPHPCDETAVLVRFPEPFGLRAYCEEGHVEVLSPLSIPGTVVSLKGPTD